MIDLNEMQIVTAVAQEGSFTRAAAALEISKAAASRAIASLEERLNIRLFERTTRRTRLTEAGETYLEYAKRALEAAEAAEAALSNLAKYPRGTLRIAAPVTMARSIMAPLLAPFLQEFSELKLDITIRGGQIDPIAQRVDVAFQTTRPEADSQMIQRRLAVVERGLYASPRYLQTAPPLVRPSDLARHSCLTLTATREETTWTLERRGRKEEIRVRGRVVVGDPEIQLRLCVDSLGIAILSEHVAKEATPESSLVRVLPQWKPPALEIFVAYPTRLSLTPKLNSFLKMIERHLKTGT